jgi:hypothetical protein
MADSAPEFPYEHLWKVVKSCSFFHNVFAHTFIECKKTSRAFGKTKSGHDSFFSFFPFFCHVKPLGVGFIGIWHVLGFALSSSYSGKACPLERYVTHIEPNEV